MHEKLIKDAFETTKKNFKKEVGREGSSTEISKRLSNILLTEYKVSFTDKSLRNLFNNCKEIKQEQVVDALCKFLGHENYQDYVKSIKKDNEEGEKEDKKEDVETKNPPKKPLPFYNFLNNRIVQGGLIIIIFTSIIFMFSIKKQRWMVWEVDRYVEVSFQPKKHGLSNLKLYREDLILNFRKVECDCTTIFFNSKGQALIWYGRNYKGKLEYFTGLALHPETGKGLKAITHYMIDKYICSKNREPIEN